MMRSLYSAITGLKNHQISMDVIGNNIANVNTPGYKRSRSTFANMLGQELRGSSAPDQAGSYGGTNGIMIGLGSILGAVDTIMSQGSSQYTGKQTDMMLQGEGMFVLKLGGENVYTRVGNFSFDKEGNFIDPASGAFVQGYENLTAPGAGDPPTIGDADWGDSTTPLVNIQFSIGEDLDPDANGGIGTGYKLTSYSIDKFGTITGVYSNGDQAVTRELYKIAVANFSNTAGLTAQGNNFYTESNNSGAAMIGFAGSEGRGTIVPNNLEMSNVDLSQEFTDMIVTQRGFQANSRVITVSDTLLQELVDLKR
ncbi:MAG: flagellar hook protein FlgE [Desulfitobacteriia bacterium]|jgi:flagellar hook protein FlgE